MINRSFFGFALVSVLLANAVIGLVMLSFLSALNIGSQQVQSSRQKLLSSNMESILARLMTPYNCICHFRNKVIDTTDIDDFEIDDLDSIYAGCDLTNDENLVVTEEEDLGSGLVSQIRISNFEAGCDLSVDRYCNHFLGDLLVTYHKMGQVPYQTSVPMIFIVDPVRGTDETRPIISCRSQAYEAIGTVCYKYSGDDEYTLVGCRRTTDNEIRGETAFGFQTGGHLRSSRAYRGNVYFGYQAGISHIGFGNTFLGYQAGYGGTDNSYNLFVGYRAGFRSDEDKNVFIGSESGVNSTTGGLNVFLGYRSGADNQGGERNVFVGSEAGVNARNTNENVFLGYQAGRDLGVTFTPPGSTTPHTYVVGERDKSVIVGSQAGLQNKTGSHSVIIGLKAGQDNIDIDESVIIGTEAAKQSSDEGGHQSIIIGLESGLKNEKSGSVFIGHKSGKANTSGEQNTFVGHGAGLQNKEGNKNTYIGYQAGLDNTEGSENVFLGFKAGQRSTIQNNNTLIGYKVAGDGIASSNNVFISPQSAIGLIGNEFTVGNKDCPRWLYGTISTSYQGLFIDSTPPCDGGDGQTIGTVPVSSRALKKNIQLIRDVDKSLKDILKTPLFTYQYKNQLNYPEKVRMGVIAEELPEHLQLGQKGRLVRPDWPSIYGTFWAGIQSLYRKIESFRKRTLFKVKGLILRVHQLKKGQAKLERDFKKAKREYLEVKSQLEEVYREMDQVLRRKKKVFRKTSRFPVIKKTASPSHN